VCVGSGHGCGESLFPVIVELPIEQMAVDAIEGLQVVLKVGGGGERKYNKKLNN
jgi:hypothetical protein